MIPGFQRRQVAQVLGKRALEYAAPFVNTPLKRQALGAISAVGYEMYKRRGATATPRRRAYRRNKTYKKRGRGIRSKSLTYQKDYAVTYSKRNTRRRRGRFSSKVNRVIDSRLAKNTYIFTQPWTSVSAGTGNPQTYKSVAIYCANQQYAPEKDLYTMFLDQHQGEHGNQNTNLIGDRLSVISCVLEFGFKAPFTTPNNADALELEIYECVPKFNFGSNADATTFDQHFFNLSGQIPVLANGTTPTTTDLGYSPFDNKAFCGQFTVVKSQKYLVQPGNTISYRMVNRRAKMITYNKLQDRKYIRGISRFLLYRVQWTGVFPASNNMAFETMFKKTYSITRDEENEPSVQKF